MKRLLTDGSARPSGLRDVVLTLALGVYTLVLGAEPFLHHDFACHLRSRTHCTSCQLNASISGISDSPDPLTPGLSETCPVARLADSRPRSADIVQSHGRSPPA